LWRRETIVDAGGWQADTLTEDLDLSYRAQLNGWQMAYAPQVVCPAEIPVTANAFKSQQHRWAKGSIQTAKKNWHRLIKADVSFLVKLQAFLHLTHYLVHPMMLIVVLTTLPILFAQWFFDNLAFSALIFSVLCLATFGPSTLYLLSQRLLYRNWKSRLKYLPVLMCLGTGIAVNNTRAVIEALFGMQSGFVRTPKFGIEKRQDRWKNKRYTNAIHSASLAELLLGLYSLAGLLMFILFSKYLVSPFLLIYASGFFYVFFLSLKQGFKKEPRS
jgi:hypothetical protein